MEYHADRFRDASVLVCGDDGRVVAAFPASIYNDTVSSHAGLTYGGLLMPPALTQVDCIAAFDAIATHFRALGVRRILYKPVPHVFHRSPAEEDLYAVARHGAALVRRDVSCVIDLAARLPYSKGRKWSVNKAKQADTIAVVEAADLAAFHELLTYVLARHDVVPVHSLEELRVLAAQFPGIRLFEARDGDELLAGALVFDFGHAVHTQYLAVSDAGRDAFALDLLIDRLLADVFSSRRHFSFGISTESQGTVLNEGLQRQKEGFGARAVVHDVYEWVL
jgi:hypothetical protein